jgi:hypothetical protein
MMIKVQRMVGPKRTERSDFQFFVDNPEIYQDYINYREFSCPNELLGKVYGLCRVEKMEVSKETTDSGDKKNKRKHLDIGE